MKGLLAKRPATGPVALLVVFAAGGVMAHQSRPGSTERPTAPLSLARKKSPPPPPASWKTKLVLAEAQPSNGKLAQTLDDGTRVTYTLDPKLQDWARRFLASHELPYSAMVMYEVESGRTILLAGHSSRDAKLSAEQLCLSPWAPAASVFKLITAAALLDRGLPSSTEVCYHGGLRALSKRHIVDDSRLDTACRSFSFAVAKSVNPIMGKLALRHLGREALQSWSERFGFNQAIPFELAVEPSRATIPAGDLELARVAAGFWQTEISALHAAVIAGVAAAGGELRWPRIVEEVERGGKRLPGLPETGSRRLLDRSRAAELARMMRATTTYGTGRSGFYSPKGRPYLPGVEVAGKTGSLSRSNPYLHYNWFAGFAPARRPKVAFAVLLGNPERWRVKAPSVARMMLERYFATSAVAEQVAEVHPPATTGPKTVVAASLASR